MLDVFSTDAFNVISMTAAINRMPYVPGLLGKLNLFTEQPITTEVAVIEYAMGRLQLLQSSQRGGPSKNQTTSKKRRVRTFRVPHVQNESQILADDVQGIRAFGSETEVETHAALVNDRLEDMRLAHEVTHEYHRAGAICGQILDADGSVIYDLFEEFGLTEDSYELPLAGTLGEMKAAVRQIIRDIEDELGATPYKYIAAICDDEFYDNLITCAAYTDAYALPEDGKRNREQEGRDDPSGFEFLGVTWINYRGKVSSTNFLQGTNIARFFPVGAKDAFVCPVAPADYIETVNTRGKLLYSKQERMKFDKGIDIESQSNALFMCTMPGILKSVTIGY